MTEREEALEPCPLCASPHVTLARNLKGEPERAFCKVCDCSAPINKWNRRPLKPHVREEALEEAAKRLREALKEVMWLASGKGFPHTKYWEISHRALKSSPPPKGGDDLPAEMIELAACIEAEPAFNPITNATVVQAFRSGAIEIMRLKADLREANEAISELQQEACNRDGVPMPSQRPVVERLRKALAPLAAKKIPFKPQGNAGMYSFLFTEIEDAKAALSPDGKSERPPASEE